MQTVLSCREIFLVFLRFLRRCDGPRSVPLVGYGVIDLARASALLDGFSTSASQREDSGPSKVLFRRSQSTAGRARHLRSNSGAGATEPPGPQEPEAVAMT